MDDREYAVRLAAWTWAAELLGAQPSEDRLDGLVHVTRAIRTDLLKPALQAVMTSQDSGFLPNPGAVIQAGNRLAHRQREALQASARESEAESLRLTAGTETPSDPGTRFWKAYMHRLATDAIFKSKVDRAREQRFAWRDQELERQLGRRKVGAKMRIEMARSLIEEAERHFPRPDPFADGWTMPEDAPDPIGALVSRTSRR